MQMPIELSVEILSSFFLFDVIGFSLLLALPLIMSALQMSREEKIKAGEESSPEALLDWRFIFCYSLSRPQMAIFGFFYILSALFLMTFFLFGFTYGILGVYITFGATILVFGLSIAVPYFYFALKMAVKILKGEL